MGFEVKQSANLGAESPQDHFSGSANDNGFVMGLIVEVEGPKLLEP